MTSKKDCSWSKIIIFEKWPQVTLLYEFDVESLVDTSKTCKILLYFGKWQICPLFVSRPNTYEWVSESLKCTKVAVNDFVGCIWMQTKILLQKKLFRTPTKFSLYVFWEMTQGYPTWCRVVSSNSSRGSPSTYICRNKHDCIWTKLPWVELS